MRRILVTALALSFGCRESHGDPRADHAPAPAPAPSATGAATPHPPPSTDRHADQHQAAMTSDFPPYLAFRAHAAARLKVPPDQLEGGGTTEAAAQGDPHNVGAAWAYTMWLRADRRQEVRGWVTADGTIITPEQNLGRLFVEAGTWSKAHVEPPRVLAKDMAARKRDLQLVKDKLARDRKLAEQLLWWYGANYFLDGHLPAPKLALEPDGSGTFRFVAGTREPGPGGAGGGPVDHVEISIALTAQHKATLTRTPFHPTP